MQGIIVMILFLICGATICDALFTHKGILTRLWLGCSLGFVLMMWLPSLFAFALKFTKTAQYYALACAILPAAVAAVWRHKVHPVYRSISMIEECDDPPAVLVLALVLPFLLLSAVLQYTHTLRNVDGALHVGQSTFGDLSLHVGIATGLRNAAYPPEYTLLPGTLLGYPFLMDALSATMLVLGTPLQWAFIIPSTLMMGLVFWGFIMLSWEMTHNKRAIILAFFLMFVNGGLGFLYIFDHAFSDSSMLYAALFDYYQAPTNMPELNLRWVNVIADMMIPQRTLLAGWLMVLPALWLFLDNLKESRWPGYIMLGVWVGAMPLVHTHTFLAMGMLSAGILIYLTVRKNGQDKRQIFLFFLTYGAIAVALALPQLLTWTFPQSIAGRDGGSNSLAFRLNWVNWEEGGLIDGYFWFWIKNVGPVYLLMIPAALSCSSRRKAMACGALAIYIIAELIQFQPNPYDNNKLFYIAFIVMAPLAAQYLVAIFDRLKGLRGRYLLATIFLCISLLSGGVTLVRECISDYQLFSAAEARAGVYVDEHALADATFLTGTQHNNAIAVLSGRKITCGTSSFLYYHGIDFSRQLDAVYSMYQSPAENSGLFNEYNVDYIYVSSYERDDFSIDEYALANMYPLWYEDEDITIFAVSPRAQASLE